MEKCGGKGKDFGTLLTDHLRPLVEATIVQYLLADLLFIISNIGMRMIIADVVADNIEEASTELFQWFYNNLLKNNPEKCHLLISSNEKITVKVGEYEIPNSECEELLGVKLDWKLNIDDHISNGCKKVCEELDALVRIATFIGLSKRNILMNACFNYKFSYFRLLLDEPQPHK